ncbi:MAG: CocE/NonD family hydrolase, partial [Cyanobacteria bacterium J083]
MTPIIKETASMYTRAGIRLDADIYRPETTEKLPVLLMRQPYGRAIASTVVYAHPSWYAACGYIVVIQDVRGRGTSAGEFELFRHEIDDGLDTIEWAANLPGSNGKVGMYGFSYQGMTQLYAAIAKPSALKVLCPAMLAYDLYSDWAYENGAFCLLANLAWAIQLAAETARLAKDEVAYEVLYAASRHLPFYNPSQAFIQSFAKYDPYYAEWLSHPQPDEYWQQLSPKYLLADVDLPMLHIGGWFDPYLRGNLNLYQAMVQRSKYPQHLVIAPWAHLPWGRKLGQKDYGVEAISAIDRLQVRWFDYWLKGKQVRNDVDKDDLSLNWVSLFEIGSNKWIHREHLPLGYHADLSEQEDPQYYYLHSNGLASIREDAGILVTEPKNIPNQTDTIVHDPWRPVPALGGHANMPGGQWDRSSLDCRSDILTYTSAPLEEDLAIAGVITVQLYCYADTPTFDLSLVLSEVTPTQQVYNFTQGYARFTENLSQFQPDSLLFSEAKSSLNLPLTIPLQPICIRLKQGNCLRLSISGACFPAYSIN